MTFKFYCRHCGQHIEADDFMAGTTDQCPTCHQSILVMPDVETNTVVLRSQSSASPESQASVSKKASSSEKRKENVKKQEFSFFPMGKWIILAFFLLNLLWLILWAWPERWEYKTVPLFLSRNVSSLQEQCDTVSRHLNQGSGKWELISLIPGEKGTGNETGEPALMLLFRAKRCW